MTLHYPKMRFSPFLLFFLALLALAMQGCGGGSGGESGGETPNADSTGYYGVSGRASVGDDSSGMLTIIDLQGMVNGTRFIAISDAKGLVYDGMITEINGNDFTATVSVFQNGTPATDVPVTVTGMITAGEKITGTLTGSGLGSGSFELFYAQSNDTPAALSRVQTNVDVENSWVDSVGGGATNLRFVVNSTGNITSDEIATDGTFSQCSIDQGAISPITGTSLYTLNLTLSSCSNTAVNGDYSGLASLRTESVETPVGDRLVVVVSNSKFSLQGEFWLGGIV